MSRRSELFRQIDADIAKAKQQSEEPGYNAALVRRAVKRMMRVDDMPRDLREVVHEYGLELVHIFLEHGVRRPASIRYLIDSVRGEAFPNGQPQFKVNKGPN